MMLSKTNLALAFSCIGHTYSHLFVPIFFILVPLALEQQLELSHGETVALIVAGNVMFGIAAPVAGWLADRWSTIGMMAVFFLGTGIAMMMIGYSDTALEIGIWLAVTGTFASIYHPVGIAWIVKVTTKTGTALGINGIFGGLGPALAAIMTGLLFAQIDWRAAYIVPGIVVLSTGIIFIVCIFKGWIVEDKVDRRPAPPPVSRRDTIRVFLILAFTVTCTGVIYQATNPALPKAFTMDFGAETVGVFSVSAIIATIYAASGLMQVIGGRLADTFPPRRVYVLSFLFQVPMLALAGMVGGGPLVAIAIIMVSLSSASLPAENMIIARYTPLHRRGLVYGLKFVLGLGFASVGILLEGKLFDMSGNFYTLFLTLAAIAAAGTLAIMMLPAERADLAAQPAE
jgi:FSR family fosmidomycin resistance protein-like MFS transporter